MFVSERPSSSRVLTSVLARAVVAMLILFGRHPTPGRCKSRLARALNSDEAAAAIYDAIVRVVLLRTSRERDDRDTGGLQLKFSCASSDDVAACEALFATGGRWRACARNARDAAAIEVEAQTQVDDLGARIVEAFRREVDDADDARSSDSSIGRAVCVAGTDVPEFSRALALEALAIVEGASTADAPRVAFGPSRDGGFYCVAARATRENCDALARALAGVRWSASTTLEECARNCHANGFDVRATMPELLDVDDDGDLDALLAERLAADDEREFPAVRDAFAEMVRILENSRAARP